MLHADVSDTALRMALLASGKRVNTFTQPAPDLTQIQATLGQLTAPQLAFICEARGLKASAPDSAALAACLAQVATRGVADHGHLDDVKRACLALGVPQENSALVPADEREWRRRLKLLEEPLTPALVHHILHPHTAASKATSALSQPASPPIRAGFLNPPTMGTHVGS